MTSAASSASATTAPPRPTVSPRSRLDLLWLALALAATWAAAGPWGLALAGWLAPLFGLRFLRARRGWLGYLAIWLGSALVMGLALRGIVPIPGIGYVAFVAVAALLALTPFLIDRLLAPRLPLWAGTLVFPAAVTLLEYGNGFGPFGSFGSSAYIQAGVLPVVQLAALGGLWAIVFLIHWVAAAGALLWTQLEQGGGRGVRAALPALLPAALALVATFVWGSARLALAPATATESAASSVAMLTSDASFIADTTGRETALAGTFDRMMAGGDDALRARWADAFDASNARLLARSAEAAAAGAELVLWAEGNALALPENEAVLMTAARELARREGITLGVAVAVLTPGAERPLENTLIVVTPDGVPSERYLKANPVPGSEAAGSVAGSASLLLTDTPFGLAAGMICFDADFPAFVADAGRAGAALLLLPTNDWTEVRRLHADMAVFRAVENGAPLVRAASNGISLVADAWGRVLAERDDYAPGTDTLLAPLPTATAATLYPRLGDVLVGASLALLLALGGWVGGAAVVRRVGARRRRAAPEPV